MALSKFLLAFVIFFLISFSPSGSWPWPSFSVPSGNNRITRLEEILLLYNARAGQSEPDEDYNNNIQIPCFICDRIVTGVEALSRHFDQHIRENQTYNFHGADPTQIPSTSGVPSFGNNYYHGESSTSGAIAIANNPIHGQLSPFARRSQPYYLNRQVQQDPNPMSHRNNLQPLPINPSFRLANAAQQQNQPLMQGAIARGNLNQPNNAVLALPAQIRPNINNNAERLNIQAARALQAGQIRRENIPAGALHADQRRENLQVRNAGNGNVERNLVGQLAANMPPQDVIDLADNGDDIYRSATDESEDVDLDLTLGL